MNQGESYDAFSNRMYTAFRDTFNPGETWEWWMAETFPDRVIAQHDDQFFAIPYTDAGDAITFAPSTDWQTVERKSEWVDVVTKARSERAKAKFPWDDCMSEQMDRYGDEETAKKVCGKIKAENKARKLTDTEYKEIEDALGIAPPHRSFKARVLDVLASVFKSAAPEPDPAHALQSDSITVYKQADGKHRWVLLSSNAYRDNDGEIVSEKALAADVARADADGDYGPLKWWHTDLVLGDCDFNAMHGRMLIESGTFKDNRVAEKVKEHAAELGGSLGFRHPKTDPDQDGVYKNIRRFERSLLPLDRAGAILTALPVITQKESSMDEKKLQVLKGVLGDELAEQVVKEADARQKAADEAGVAHKEKTETTPVAAITTPATPVAVTLEQVTEIVTKAISEIKQSLDSTAAFKERDDRLGKIEQALNELTGDLPRAVKSGFRASQSGDTVVDAAKTKELTPPADPIFSMVDALDARKTPVA